MQLKEGNEVGMNFSCWWFTLEVASFATRVCALICSATLPHTPHFVFLTFKLCTLKLSRRRVC